jgi:DNA-binding transcriptional ArsR family regulator
MTQVTDLAAVASLLGDPARAGMLAALMDGRAHTATELAGFAHIARPTASGHLARLLEGGLVAAARQGRHRYYRLASPEVARMIEAVGAVAAAPRPRLSPAAAALREARTCYDHLAGRVAVAVADALAARGHVLLDGEGGEVTPEGMAALGALGLDLARPRGRAFCRPCLDWTERRPHLGGAVGAALLCRCEALGWVRRSPDSRAVRITPAGRAGLAAAFGVA